MVQLDDVDTNSSDSDDSSDDLAEIRRNREQYEQINPLTIEDTVTVNLNGTQDPKEVRVGANLPVEKATCLIALLKGYQNVFVWSYSDMPGLDPRIVEYSLPTNLDMPPKKQKLRRTKLELLKKIEEEVMKLLKVGFIDVSQYPDWVANIVPVKKKDGRIRVCVDYCDLNKASPKDDFPLPYIDVLIDSTAGFELFYFMDEFTGYN